ncbi:MAG: hypothetical protein WAS51_14595 [Ilumatobacteraceae bacterium]
MTGTYDVGRLAFRVEGSMWVAYYAKPGTLEGALVLGSLHMKAVEDNPRRKAEFMEMMKGFVSDIIRNVTGDRPSWREEKAPVNERSGRA